MKKVALRNNIELDIELSFGLDTVSDVEVSIFKLGEFNRKYQKFTAKSSKDLSKIKAIFTDDIQTDSWLGEWSILVVFSFEGSTISVMKDKAFEVIQPFEVGKNIVDYKLVYKNAVISIEDCESVKSE